MIHTIKPDDRGRVSLLPYLKLIGWEPGDLAEINLIKVVKIKTKKKKKKDGDKSEKPQ